MTRSPARQPRRPLHAFSQGYGAILAALLLLLTTFPLLETFDWVGYVVDVAVVVMIVAALARAWKRRSEFWIGVVLGVAASTLNALSSYDPSRPLVLWSHLLTLAFEAWLAFMIFRDIATRRRVTLDSVLGAACVYLLIAFCWAHVYFLLETLQPGAFSFPHTDTGDPVLRYGALLYFSLITLTTVGYGDITPLALNVRFLAAVEGVIAQLFLVIAMARLVSLELSNRLRDEP